VEQEYLPPGAKSRPYWEPTEQGLERKIAERLKMWKDELERRRREGSSGG